MQEPPGRGAMEVRARGCHTRVTGGVSAAALGTPVA